MAFTYEGDLSNPIEYVRFRINDKDEEVYLFEDAEIQYFIDKAGARPSEKDLDKVALTFLKQMLREIMTSASREEAGRYAWYNTTAEMVKLLISELEKDIKSASPTKPYFGGVVKSEVENIRNDPQLVDSKFYEGVIYGS